MKQTTAAALDSRVGERVPVSGWVIISAIKVTYAAMSDSLAAIPTSSSPVGIGVTVRAFRAPPDAPAGKSALGQ